MRMSENINELAKALAIFQKEVVDPRKDANNPFFKSKYVTLDALINAVRPVLTKNGLSFIQFPAGDGTNISVTTLLMHTSGQFIETEPFVMKATKNDPQGAGSAVTYGRRYSLQSVLGVTWCDEDDDGNAASTKEASKNASVKAKNASIIASNEEIAALAKEIGESGIDMDKVLAGYKIKSLQGISVELFQKIWNAVQKRKGQA